jgi:hypothetical protein
MKNNFQILKERNFEVGDDKIFLVLHWYDASWVCAMLLRSKVD